MDMNEKEIKAYISYQDEGPSGACGQGCHITSPWNNLYIVNGTMAAIKEYLEKLLNQRRKKMKINVWFDDEEYDDETHKIIKAEL